MAKAARRKYQTAAQRALEADASKFQPRAYRGYTITPNWLRDAANDPLDYRISKSGFHIGTAATLESAQAMIAQLAENPGMGTDFEFHGAYATKPAALRRERDVGGFTVPRRIRGKLRYVVLRRRDRRGTKTGPRRQANPAIFVAGNRGELMSREVQYIEYKHVTEGDRYHDFRPGVRMEALPDGSLRLYHPTRRLARDDGR